jgi:tryptophan-rich sensory protein
VFKPLVLQCGFYAQLLSAFLVHQSLFHSFLTKDDRIDKRQVALGATIVSAATAVWAVLFFRLQDPTASFCVGAGALVVSTMTLCKLCGISKRWAVVLYVLFVLFQATTMTVLPFLAWSRGGRYASRRVEHRQFGQV